MSTLKVNTLQNTSGVEVYTCKAWVNFNGTGTVAIRASGNVSSITDNGTGDYTLNFTTALADANYSISTNGQESLAGSTRSDFGCTIRQGSSISTSSVRINTFYITGVSVYDAPVVMVAVFR
jgi:hypothetical protein